MNKREIRETIDEGGVHFRCILEMVGKPKEHIQSTLKDYVGRMQTSEDYTILNQEFQEPKQMEDSEMFSVFVELEILAKGVENVVWFCFDWMPSSMEIIDPDEIHYSAHHFTDFLNDLQARLHHVDMAVKQTNAKNQKLNTNSEALLRNSIKLSINKGSSSVDEISKDVGVQTDNLQKILDTLIEKGMIKKTDNGYVLKD